MDTEDVKRIQAKADLIEAARAHDAEQAKRAIEFQAQVDKAFGRKPRQRDPITWAELRKHLSGYLYSTCLPGRIMPALLWGNDYESHSRYVPIEKRLAMVQR